MTVANSQPVANVSASDRGSAIARLAASSAAEGLDAAGAAILRYGLVAIVVFFGAFKFTAAEANGIQPLVSNSPFLSWLYSFGSVRAVSDIIGATEIAIAVLIGLRRFSPALSAVGSLGAVGMFAVTLTFLATTPGVWVAVPGFPLPVPNEIGAFLVKDLFLLGAASWSAAEALRALRSR